MALSPNEEGSLKSPPLNRLITALGKVPTRIGAIRRKIHPGIRLEAVLAAMHDAVAIADTRGFFVDFNEAFARLNRFESKSACARALGEYTTTFEAFSLEGALLTPEQWPIPRALRGESGTGFILKIKRRDTGEEWIAIHNFAPIKRDGGVTVGAVLTARDMTEERKVEEHLQDLSSRLSLDLKSARLGIWDWDIINDRVKWDERMFELYGVNQATFTPSVKVWGETLLHPEDRDATLKLLQESLKGQREYDTTFRIIHSNGEVHYIKANGVVLRGRDNQPERMLGVNVDITEEILAKDTLQRAYAEVEAKVAERTAQLEAAKVAAENANRAKDNFLAILSHELRSPLSAILSWTQLIERGALSPEKMQVAMRTIKDSVWAQNQLIGDLLDLSRISTGKLHIDCQPTRVADVLRAAIDVIRPGAEQRGLILEEHIDATETFIYADPARLKQSLWNLLTNAVKFTPSGGRITVSLLCVDESGSEVVKIIVKDTGRGIKAEFLPQLFQRFSQAEPSSVRIHGGMGLGLSLVKSLVELQNGTITAESAGEGLGATFTMTFPLIAQSWHDLSESLKAPETTGVSDGHDLHNIKVLLVEDGEKTRVALAQLLSAQGADVQAEPSAKDALDAFPKFKPDVLVSDIAMPQEDGHSLMRKIRALSHDCGGGTPAIALTAYAEPRDRDEAFASGFQEYMNKPIDVGALAKTIIKLVRPQAST